jgi:hypothetical protein
MQVLAELLASTAKVQLQHPQSDKGGFTGTATSTLDLYHCQQLTLPVCKVQCGMLYASYTQSGSGQAYG